MRLSSLGFRLLASRFGKQVAVGERMGLPTTSTSDSSEMDRIEVLEEGQFKVLLALLKLAPMGEDGEDGVGEQRSMELMGGVP